MDVGSKKTRTVDSFAVSVFTFSKFRPAFISCFYDLIADGLIAEINRQCALITVASTIMTGVNFVAAGAADRVPSGIITQSFALIEGRNFPQIAGDFSLNTTYQLNQLGSVGGCGRDTILLGQGGWVTAKRAGPAAGGAVSAGAADGFLALDFIPFFRNIIVAGKGFEDGVSHQPGAEHYEKADGGVPKNIFAFADPGRSGPAQQNQKTGPQEQNRSHRHGGLEAKINNVFAEHQDIADGAGLVFFYILRFGVIRQPPAMNNRRLSRVGKSQNKDDQTNQRYGKDGIPFHFLVF